MGGVKCGFLISMFLMMTIVYAKQIKGIDIPLILYAGFFPLWILFYVLGLWLKKHPQSNLLVPAILTIAGFGLSLIETYYLYPFQHNSLGIKTSSFIYALGGILLLLSNPMQTHYKSNFLLSNIEWLGRNSLGIYFCHCYIISMLVRADALLGIELCDKWVFKAIITIILSCIFMVSVKKHIPKISKYIGFR